MGGSVNSRAIYMIFPQQNLSLVSLDAMSFVPSQFQAVSFMQCATTAAWNWLTETSYFSACTPSPPPPPTRIYKQKQPNSAPCTLRYICGGNTTWLWARQLSQYSDWLWAGRSGIEFRWGRDFPPVQTSPGAHPASCTMGTGSFPGGKVRPGGTVRPGRAADHSPPSSAAVMEE